METMNRKGDKAVANPDLQKRQEELEEKKQAKIQEARVALLVNYPTLNVLKNRQLKNLAIALGYLMQCKSDGKKIFTTPIILGEDSLSFDDCVITFEGVDSKHNPIDNYLKPLYEGLKSFTDSFKPVLITGVILSRPEVSQQVIQPEVIERVATITLSEYLAIRDKLSPSVIIGYRQFIVLLHENPENQTPENFAKLQSMHKTLEIKTIKKSKNSQETTEILRIPTLPSLQFLARYIAKYMEVDRPDYHHFGKMLSRYSEIATLKLPKLKLDRKRNPKLNTLLTISLSKCTEVQKGVSFLVNAYKNVLKSSISESNESRDTALLSINALYSLYSMGIKPIFDIGEISYDGSMKEDERKLIKEINSFRLACIVLVALTKPPTNS